MVAKRADGDALVGRGGDAAAGRWTPEITFLVCCRLNVHEVFRLATTASPWNLAPLVVSVLPMYLRFVLHTLATHIQARRMREAVAWNDAYFPYKSTPLHVACHVYRPVGMTEGVLLCKEMGSLETDSLTGCPIASERSASSA